MTVRVDQFQRANGPLGANWTDWSVPLQIVSDQVSAANAVISGETWTADTIGPTQFSMVTAATIPASSDWIGCSVRSSSNGANGYLGLWLGSGTFFLFKMVSNSPATLVSTGGFMATGDTLCITASGTTIALLHNGSQVLTTTDSTYPTGQPGIGIFGQSPRMTPWIGGDGAVPPFAANTGTVAGDGTQTWLCTSPLNGPSPTVLRITPPTSPAAGYPHSLLVAEPVSTLLDATFGDPVTTIIDDLGAHNTYNTTLVVPSYVSQPWLCDTPGTTAMSQESFNIALQSWLSTSSFATTGQEKTYLIGFSKSGLGGSALLFKHPSLFAAGAFWDSPFQMTAYDGTDPNGTVGGAPSFSYGSDANFQADYRLSSTNIQAWNTAAGNAFSSSKRICVGGWFAFQGDVSGYESFLTGLGIQYTNFINSQDASHAWHDDWVNAALPHLFTRATSSGLLMASGVI